MLEETQEREEIVERVAALDVGKSELVCCVRVPGTGGRRTQEVTTYSTMTRSLLGLAGRLRELRVTRVVMEATSDYWKPPIRELRDLTRYRTAQVAARSAEKNRVEKLLEDAQVKLGAVASDIFGVSGRDMMAALLAGERDPKALAQLARGRTRSKAPDLQEAFTGRFSDHHAFLLSKVLARIDTITADVAELDARIAELVAPFGDAAARLDEIPGVGATAASVVIAEIGIDMTRFPTPAHLAPGARFAPGANDSAGRRKGNGTTGRGNRYLAAVLGDAAVGASRTDTFLGERYRRIARRRGKKKAMVAIGRSILVICWHLLSDSDARYHDLGADHYHAHANTSRQRRAHVRQLQALGYQVTLEPAA